MPVIAVGVVNKQGHIILARSYNEISRIRLEGLLSAFPRLLESSLNKQVTYIDAGAVRYVYQPLEELFLVLITTKSSNIVEDLATLHLMGRLIPEYVDAVNETELESKTFRVFFALDEVIVGGRRESTTVEQIKTYLEMESHEEMMVREEKRLQMERAKKDASRKAHELRDKRRKGLNPYSGISSDDAGYAGFGSDVGVGSNNNNNNNNNNMMMTGMRDNIGNSANNNYNNNTTVISRGVESSSTGGKKQQTRTGGLTLGKAKKADITSRVLKEAGLPPTNTTNINNNTNTGANEKEAATIKTTGTTLNENAGNIEGIHIIVEEKISGQLNRDGEGGNVDIRGELSVLVSDPQLSTVKLILAPMNSDFSFRAHAKVNKEMFADDHVLAMRENKPFPVQQPVTILRWRLQNPSTVRPPLIISCWPSVGSITVEYELGNPNESEILHDIRIMLPLYGATIETMEPSVGNCSILDNCVLWVIPRIDVDTNASGNVEVSIVEDNNNNNSGNVFFPVNVNFISHSVVGQVKVLEAVQTESGAPVRFSHETRLVTEGYTVA